MASCGICAKSISAKQLKVNCSDCKLDFHAVCMKMSKAEVDCIVTEGIPWRCQPCAESRRKSMRFEAQAQEGKVTLDDLMKKINKIVENQKEQEASFNKSYEALHEQMEENTKITIEQKKSLDDSLKLISELVQENKMLSKKVADLEKRVDDMEQYSRMNAVEIHGIPYQKNENVMDLVKGVGTALNMNITDTMIDACHRLGKDAGSNSKPSGIIVKFVRRFDKDEILSKRRAKKRDFSTRHLNLTMDEPIFINESLSPARRKLFAATRQAKKDKHYKYLWVRGGKIFLRKEEQAPVIHVQCQTDLDSL